MLESFNLLHLNDLSWKKNLFPSLTKKTPHFPRQIKQQVNKDYKKTLFEKELWVKFKNVKLQFWWYDKLKSKYRK